MLLQRPVKGWQCFLVNAQYQEFCAWSILDLVKERLQGSVGYDFETKWRLTHFAHSLAHGGHMLGAIVRMEAKGQL
jgi:hypothetical protein